MAKRKPKNPQQEIQGEFLCDIRENPSDDETRLIYADWLQDNGPGEKVANLWRTEVALRQAQRAEADTTSELAAYQAAFAAVKKVREYREALRGTEINHKGFLEISATQFGKYGKTLTETLGFRSVKLSNIREKQSREFYSKYFSDKAFSRLERLDLGENFTSYGYELASSAAVVQALAASKNFTNLTHLSLFHSYIGDEGVAALVDSKSKLTHLTHLDLGGNYVSTENAQALARSPRLAGLTSLDLSETSMRYEGVAALAASRTLTNLKHLSLKLNLSIGVASVQALAASENLAGLTSLDLYYTNIHNDSVQALTGSESKLTHLTHLNLGRNNIDSRGVQVLVGSPHLAGLRSLDLSGNRISAAGAQALVGSESKLTNLKSLNLAQSIIGAVGARALAGSPHLAGLTHLNLYENYIGDEGAAALAGSPHLAGLTSLNLSYNRIDDAGRKALKEAGWTENDFMDPYTRPARTPEVPAPGEAETPEERVDVGQLAQTIPADRRLVRNGNRAGRRGF